MIEDARPVVDLRLLPAAGAAWLACWTATGGVARWPDGAPVGPEAAALLGAAALAVLLALALAAGSVARGRGRPGPGGAAALLAGAGAVAGLAGTAAVLGERAAGPVPGWVADRAAATVTGRLSEDPVPVPAGRFGGPPRWAVTLTAVQVTARGRQGATDAPVAVLGTSPRWAGVTAGSRVRVGGRFLPPRGATPEVGLLLASRDPQVRAGGRVWRVADRLRAGLRRAAHGHGADADGLLPALVVGDVSRLSADLTAAMRATGLTHLTAVSGANLTIVAGGAVWLAVALGAGRVLRVLVAAAAIAGFVVLARPAPSVLRAAVMATIGLAGLLRGRPGRGLPALAGCVLVLLCADPWLCRSFGFALSVCATGGLVLLAPRLADRWSRFLPAPVAVALAVPVAAEAFTAPVAVLLRPALGLVSLPANLLVAPAVGPATVLGVVAALASTVSSGLAHALALPGLWATGWVAAVAHRAAAVPHGAVPLPSGVLISVLLALSAVLVTLLAVRPGRVRGAVPMYGAVPVHGAARVRGAAAALRPARPVLAVCLVVVGFLGAGLTGPPGLPPGWPSLGGLPFLRRASAWPPAGWVMVLCAVGQGDALVLRTGPGRAVLVDAGPDPALVDGCLTRLAVHRLDLVVLTHPHSDHISGLAGALRGRTVGRALVSPSARPVQADEQARRLLGSAGAAVTEAWAGDSGTAGDVAWQVRWPVPAPGGGRPLPVAEDGDRALEDSAVNDASVVLQVAVHGVTLLALGDLETEAQRVLLRSGMVGPVDVVKVSHHGSARQAPELYRRLRPRAALIGVGPNTYGHPTPQTLGLLAGVGALVLRTDRMGDVAVLQDSAGLAALPRDG